MGFIVVLLDFCVYKINSNSLLELRYEELITSALLIVIWGVGAAVGGYVGAAFGILEISRPAAITAAVGWTLILPRILIQQHHSDSEGGEEPQPQADSYGGLVGFYEQQTKEGSGKSVVQKDLQYQGTNKDLLRIS